MSAPAGRLAVFIQAVARREMGITFSIPDDELERIHAEESARQPTWTAEEVALLMING